MARDLAKAGGSSTMVSKRSRARAIFPERLEGIGLAQLDVPEAVQRRVGPGPLSASVLESRATTLAARPGQVQGEGAVIGEAVQRRGRRAG